MHDTPLDLAQAGGALPGMPQERLARLAARRAFVDMKTEFLGAVDHLDPEDEQLAALRRAVLLANEPEDLWQLQRALFTALRRDPVDGPRTRDALRTGLDSLFPPTLFASGFSGL